MSGAPTASRSPGLACNSATRPANGTGISTTAFAVSTSTPSWSTATGSPPWTCPGQIADPARLVHDDGPAGPLDRRDDGLVVKGRKGPQVDDLGAAAILLGRLGGLQRGGQRAAVGDQRDIGARAPHHGPVH